jgi:hypothetical protein
MTNDEKQEIAEKVRRFARIVQDYYPNTAAEMQSLMDELDPPLPEPGTVVQFVESGDYGVIDGNGHVHTQHTVITDPRPYKPATIARPGQVVVDVPPVSEWGNAGEIALAFIKPNNHELRDTIITRAEAERMEAERDPQNP